VWRQNTARIIKEGAREQGLSQLLHGARVEVQFRFQRPSTGTELRRQTPFTGQTPDVDKLSRALLDALQEAGVLRDDGQVLILSASKAYVDEQEHEGLCVVVEAADLSSVNGWTKEVGWCG
jgi:Holliday junction resolvase RusA-like endonuclease